jgi:DNA recombination protein RmuC
MGDLGSFGLGFAAGLVAAAVGAVVLTKWLLRQESARRTVSEQEVERLRSELSTRQTALDALRQDLAKIQAEGAALGAQYQALSELRTSLQSEKDALVLAGETLRERLSAALGQQAKLSADLENERRVAAERQAEVERSRQHLRAEFENLANRLLEEKGKVLFAENKTQLDAILTPLKERMKGFEDLVTKTYDQENRDRASLLDLVKRLGESQVKLGKEAENLSRALSGESKVQGDWGEMILENLLQGVGLTEGREYQVQEHHVAEDGSRLRPDVVVYLPDDKAIVVDSKVSISAFVAYTRAETEDLRTQALRAHCASVRGHIKDLAGKKYQDVVKGRSLDFVLLFIPSEAAFHAAIGQDPELYNDAFSRGIVLASPSTLLATLKVVAHVWQHEKQNENAQRIAQEAGRMFDKFQAFAKDLMQIGERLSQAQAAYDAAKSKLTEGNGNLAKRAQTLMKLGAKASKTDSKVDAFLGTATENSDDETSEKLN